MITKFIERLLATLIPPIVVIGCLGPKESPNAPSVSAIEKPIITYYKQKPPASFVSVMPISETCLYIDCAVEKLRIKAGIYDADAVHIQECHKERMLNVPIYECTGQALKRR